MNTDHQPQQPPTRDPACCGTCAAIVSALTPEHTITPGPHDDWTDTEEPKRAEAFVEHLPIDIGYNLCHYASPHAPHRMGEGCQCRPSRIPHIILAAPESARGGCMADFDAPQAPQEVPAPERPANRDSGLPRRIDPEDVRVGMIVERRNGDYYVGGRVATINDFHIVTDTDTPLWYASWSANSDWSLWLIEDAPAPVDPDAEALDQMAQAMANLVGSDDADEWVPWAEVALDALRETHDVTPRAEQ